MAAAIPAQALVERSRIWIHNQEIRQVLIAHIQSIALIENHVSRDNKTAIQNETANRAIPN